MRLKCICRITWFLALIVSLETMLFLKLLHTSTPRVRPRTRNDDRLLWTQELPPDPALRAPRVRRRRAVYRTQKPLEEIPCNEPWMCPLKYTQLGTCELTNGSQFTCPDIRSNSYSSLRQTQLVLTRMLRIFDLLANKYNITYWIRSGTLLGAVRHKGFIPWDDDVDIEMRLDPDYVKFFRHVAKDLPEDIFFQNSETDIYMKPENESEYARDPRVGYYERIVNPRLRDRSSCYQYCLYYECKWHDGLQVDIFINNGTTDDEFPLQKMKFEGFHFPVPNNWEQLLTEEYGEDFMKLPPKDEREPKNMVDPLRSCEEIASMRNNSVETSPALSTQAPTRERSETERSEIERSETKRSETERSETERGLGTS